MTRGYNTLGKALNRPQFECHYKVLYIIIPIAQLSYHSSLDSIATFSRWQRYTIPPWCRAFFLYWWLSSRCKPRSNPSPRLKDAQCQLGRSAIFTGTMDLIAWTVFTTKWTSTRKAVSVADRGVNLILWLAMVLWSMCAGLGCPTTSHGDTAHSRRWISDSRMAWLAMTSILGIASTILGMVRATADMRIAGLGELLLSTEHQTWKVRPATLIIPLEVDMLSNATTAAGSHIPEARTSPSAAPTILSSMPLALRQCSKFPFLAMNGYPKVVMTWIVFCLEESNKLLWI